MKIIITEEEKEEFLVRAYAYLDFLKKELKKLKAEYKFLNIIKENIEEELKPLEEEYEKLILGIKGQGIYSSTIMAPAQIRNRLGKLEHSIESPYREDASKKKQYELLKRPLEEDLEIAEQKAEEFRMHEQEVIKKLNEVRENLRTCKKELKICEKNIDKNQKETEKTHLQIQKVEKAHNNNKPIDSRILSLGLKENN